MSNASGYGQFGGGSAFMAEYDALPKPIREFLANFPFAATTASFWDQYYIHKRSVDDILRDAHAFAEQTVSIVSRNTYGPEYPCQTYSHLITSSESSATQRSHISGARSARAARPSTRARKRLYWPA